MSGVRLSVDESKAEMRKRLRALRAGAHRAHGKAAAMAVREALVALAAGTAQARVIGGYWPINEELDCRPALLDLERCGYTLALPVVEGPGLALGFRRWRFDEGLRPGPFGTRQPEPAAMAAKPDIVLVPLLAFDRRGHRLGYGGGYYDRTLKTLRAARPILAIGLAFQAQEVPVVPSDGADARLDYVVTEIGVRDLRRVDGGKPGA